MTNPKLLILDEATEGPGAADPGEIWPVSASSREKGQAILLVDKQPRRDAKIADRHVVVEKGRVVWTGTSAALAADRSVKERYLQV